MNRMSDDIIESEMKSFHLKSNFYIKPYGFRKYGQIDK